MDATSSARATAAQDKARHFGALKGLGEAAILMAIDEMLEDGRLRQYARQGYTVLAPAHRSRVVAEAWQTQHGEPAAADAAVDGEEAAAPDASPATRYTNLQRALWAWRRRLATLCL